MESEHEATEAKDERVLKLEKLEETVNRRNTQIKELKNKLSRREKQINEFAIKFVRMKVRIAIIRKTSRGHSPM